MEDDDFPPLRPALSIQEKYSGKLKSPAIYQLAREGKNLFRIRIRLPIHHQLTLYNLNPVEGQNARTPSWMQNPAENCPEPLIHQERTGPEPRNIGVEPCKTSVKPRQTGLNRTETASRQFTKS